MSLADVTRDEVRKQLKLMGYDNISDDLIEEFLQELKVSEESTTAMSNLQISSADSKMIGSSHLLSDEDDEDDEDESIVKSKHTIGNSTKQSTFQQDTTLDSDEEDEDDLPIGTTTFVSKGKQYEPPMLKSSTPHITADIVDSDDESEDQFETNIKISKQKLADPRVPLKETTGNQLNRARPHNATSNITSTQSGIGSTSGAGGGRVSAKARPQSARGSFSSTQRPQSSQGLRPGTSQSHRPSSASRRLSLSGPSVPPPRSENYRRKINDPVRRYQEMQKAWGKDRFLNSRKSNHKNLRMQVRREMREISAEAEQFGYLHVF